MSSQSAPAAPVCDWCHQKAKFGTHKYCSKTCAATAASYCNHCHLKPKFTNFEFCGKKCAALAATPSTKPSPGSKPLKNNVPQAASPPTGNGTQPTSSNIIPILSKLAQQVPQVQAFLATLSPPINPPAPQVTATAAPIQLPGGARSQSKNNPFAPPASTVQPVISSPAGGATECLIPGCGQPAHMDLNGAKISDYCSMRHREEAVASGAAAPCIMCLILPQSEADHFCSRACREEALRKP